MYMIHSSCDWMNQFPSWSAKSDEYMLAYQVTWEVVFKTNGSYLCIRKFSSKYWSWSYGPCLLDFPLDAIRLMNWKSLAGMGMTISFNQWKSRKMMTRRKVNSISLSETALPATMTWNLNVFPFSKSTTLVNVPAVASICCDMIPFPHFGFSGKVALTAIVNVNFHLPANLLFDGLTPP